MKKMNKIPQIAVVDAISDKYISTAVCVMRMAWFKENYWAGWDAEQLIKQRGALESLYDLLCSFGMDDAALDRLSEIADDEWKKELGRMCKL